MTCIHSSPIPNPLAQSPVQQSPIEDAQKKLQPKLDSGTADKTGSNPGTVTATRGQKLNISA